MPPSNPPLPENLTFHLRVPPAHDDWIRQPLKSSTALEPGVGSSFQSSLNLWTAELCRGKDDAGCNQWSP